MRMLAYSVWVPVYNTDASGNEFLHRTEEFLGGTELPEWAVPYVGKHAYAEGEAPVEAPDVPMRYVLDHDEEAGVDADGQPAGNASAEAWRAYAASLPGVNPEDVADMSRNELRDQYGTK